MRDGVDAMVPMELRERVERELEAGERVVWMERPIGRMWTTVSVAAFLFGIPWTGFAVFWMLGAAGFEWPDFREGESFFCLFGLPFILIGLGMLSSPLWVRRLARRTVYAITDRRAISIAGLWWTTVRSFYPAQLGEVYRRERRDGSGDVIIGQRAWRDSDGDRQTVEVGFEGVRDARGVEGRLRELAGRAASGESS